jgi:tetratricopeptide (TPR) repeat protein
LHAQVPADNDSLFELGQAEFWVGYVAWQRNELDVAALALERYMQHSRELQTRAPDHPEYRRELGYAYSNLGSVARERGQAGVALDYFNQNQAILRDLLTHNPSDVGLRFDLTESLSWVGSSLLDLGRLAESTQAFQETYDLLAELHAADPNPRYSSRFSEGGRLLGLTRLNQGALADASRLAAASTTINRELVGHDPANADWRRALYAGLSFQGEIALAAGANDRAAPLLAEAITGLSELNRTESGDADYLSSLARAESDQALLWLAADKINAALTVASRAQKRLAGLATDAGRGTTRLSMVTVAEVLGRVQARSGKPDQARATWTAALKLLGQPPGINITERALRMQLSADLGQTEVALALADHLRAVGFADPRFPFPPSPP